MKIRSLWLVGLLLLPLPSVAQSGWVDMKGKPVPETDSAKSREGFSATLVITPDQDWRQKWDTPPETIPRFSEADEVGADGELFILTFLSNPKVDSASGMTDVACDFVILRPDGSYSTKERDLPCFVVKLQGDPRNVYLSTAALKYVAEPTDQRGKWAVSVTVKDRFRGVEIPLNASFVVR
ncbi:hypothetical protein [uncultured Stenotrophomonas sp.]|uniref:hypothetical protein n=1 Tax=uncultured Stenotrophomonas sp. TaxID=165438 RepID=UPI0025EFF4DE|nr:hypothetical protein [uncultured Stenotrophomonas sp.]